MTEPLNLYDLVVEGDDSDPPGYRARSASFGPSIGAEKLGGTVYELDPGESVCPYHYENTEEEWLLVLTGAPTLRDPEGEHELAEGDLVCFLLGPDGAHKVTNRSDSVVRILMFSTIPETRIPGSDDRISITVYPDSDKVGVWPPGKRFRLSAENVDYWDGEV
jgi:uncharacterized cupin superfamily protein